MATETMVVDRKAEILNAATVMREEYEHWRDHTPDDTLPTAAMEQAIEDFIVICDGDVPSECRTLYARAAEFAELWRRYANQESGFIRPDFKPTATLCASLEAVLRESQGVASYRPKRVEPVHLLVKQGVGYEQIARWIYGDGKTGPFLSPNGDVLVDLVLQEAEKPGSVIPSGWIHPSERAAVEKSLAEARTRITQAVQHRTQAPKEDPLALLREGANVTQVASVCGIPAEEVYRIAEENGITPTELANPYAQVGPLDRVPSKERLAAVEPLGGATNAPDSDADGAEEFDGVDIEEFVAQLAETYPETPAAELSRKIVEQGGPKLHPNKVAAIIRRAKTEE